MTEKTELKENNPETVFENRMVCLTDLKPGETAIVKELSQESRLRRRLLDIGLFHGSAVKCIAKSPLGDPTAYLICGAVIALRKEDSALVLVQSLNRE